MRCARHPWILDITDDPNIGPNAMRHFDQSWQALTSLEASFEDKLDLITVVDEYVFGYLPARAQQPEGHPPTTRWTTTSTLLVENEYPALSAMVRRWAGCGSIPTHPTPRPVRPQPRPPAGRLRGAGAELLDSQDL